MMDTLCFIRYFSVFFIILCQNLINVTALPSPVVTISDGNWTDILNGEWMVEFMAPWCPACQSLKPTWEKVATWSRDLDMSVGVVDVTENPILSGRFLVTALPTIYHIKDGEFRRYSGSRDETSLISFVDEKTWQSSEAVSWWFNPASIHMGGVGLFFKVSMVVRMFYNVMVEEYGIPEWGCYIIFAVLTIILGLILGLMFVCCCDYFFPPRYQRHQESDRGDNQDGGQDDESDILDDTKTGDGDVRRRRPQEASSTD